MGLRALLHSALLAAAVLAARPGYSQNLLVNGSFTDGDDAPSGWEPATSDVGQLRGTRDTQVFASPPASLRIDAITAPATGKVFATIKPMAPGNYRVRGKLRAQNVIGGIAAISFSSGGQQLAWNEIAFTSGSQQFIPFDVSTCLPPGTSQILLLAFGDFRPGGVLWVDDLGIERAGSPADRAILADFAGNTLRNCYQGWGGRAITTPDGMRIVSSGSGGGSLTRWFDVSSFTSATPVLHLEVLPSNTAQSLTMRITDEAKRPHEYRFTLPPAGSRATVAADGRLSDAGGAFARCENFEMSSASGQLAVVIRGVELVAPGTAPSASLGAGGSPAPAGGLAPALLLADADTLIRTSHAYGSWTGRVEPDGNGVQVRGVDPQGGIVMVQSPDFRGLENGLPRLTMRALPGNRCSIAVMLLKDKAGGIGRWEFQVPASETPVELLPIAMKTLGAEQGIDLHNIAEVQIQGDYSSSLNLSMAFEKLEIVLPGAMGMAASPASAGAGAAAAPMFPSASDDPPIVSYVSVEGPEILAARIESQFFAVPEPRPFTPSDERLEEVPGAAHLSRVMAGEQFLGIYNCRNGLLYGSEVLMGAPLVPESALIPGNYLLSSRDDAIFRKGLPASSVQIKVRPSSFTMPTMAPILRYDVYLRFSQPLVRERNYELSFPGSAIKPYAFKYSALRLRNDAIHHNQLGYRPDDPGKIGRISLWMGSGGKLHYTPKGFIVIEEPSGKAVMQGKLAAVNADNPVAGADVYVMDFTSLKMPGQYRLYVPEMGVSEPFRVDENVWGDAFHTAMRGLYAQRSGIEISTPYADFTRPRNYHPLDGTRVELASFSLLESNLGPDPAARDYLELCAGHNEPGPVINEATGGYLDSGTSNVRRIQHLDATRMLLELYLMFPRHYSKVALAIPEAGRKEPDVLDECLWNLNLYRTLQGATGGVSGAVIDPEALAVCPMPPVAGKRLLATAPDLYSTYTYAATAARFAVAARLGSAALAATYQQSALKAMEWAESRVDSYEAPGEPIAAAIRDRRNLAAAELLRLTGQKAFGEIFLQTTRLKDGPISYRLGSFDQREATFTYARLPETLVDATIRRLAMEAVRNDADVVLAPAADNGWGIVYQQNAGANGIYAQFPAMALIHGHYLHKDDRYLQALVAHAAYMLGGNPANMSYVSGLGAQSPRHLRCAWNRSTGQPMPRGITVFGPPAPGSTDLLMLPLVTDHVAKYCRPELTEWPSGELFLDLYGLEQQTAYSVHETLGPTSYLFGYLAGR